MLAFRLCLVLMGRQMILVDTRSCIADFRTNSFVGTEGASTQLIEGDGS